MPILPCPTATPELRYIYFHSSLNFALYIMLNEEDLLEVDVLSDSEGFNDSYCRPATPMLLCYMRETGTVFSEVYREDAPGSISSKDCFSLTEDMFVGAGGFVINKCFKVQSMLEFRHAATQSASSSVSVAASSEGQLVAWKPFMPRARALSVFDLSAIRPHTLHTLALRSHSFLISSIH